MQNLINLRKYKQRRERLTKSGAGKKKKKLTECKCFYELSFPNLAGKPEESQNNFINIIVTFVMEMFVETTLRD